MGTFFFKSFLIHIKRYSIKWMSTSQYRLLKISVGQTGFDALITLSFNTWGKFPKSTPILGISENRCMNMDIEKIIGIIANISQVVATVWLLIYGGMTIKDVCKEQIEKKRTQPLPSPRKKHSRFVRMSVGMAVIVLLLTSFVTFSLNGSFIPGIRNTNTAVPSENVPYDKSNTPLSCKYVHQQTNRGITWPDFTLVVPAGCILVLNSWIGHVNTLHWSTGALVAFPPGTYAVSLQDGAYDIVPTASGQEKYCTDLRNLRRVSYIALLRPLTGWKPC